MSLYQLERDENVAGLIDYLSQSENAGIRARTAKIIGGLEVDSARRPKVIDQLVTTATDDPDSTVRTAAVDALYRLGADAIDRFIAAMYDVDRPTADVAMLEAYRTALTDDRPELRMAAVGGLARRGDHSVIPALATALTDPNPRVRERAAMACGSLGHSGATSALIDRLEDEATPVRREAAEALGQIGSPAGLEALLSRIDDSDETVRYVAVSGLGGFSSPKSVTALVEALEDSSPTVRRAAALSVIELLATAPADRSHHIRSEVLESIQVVDDATMIRPLIDIVREGTRDAYRRNAAWLLGRITGDRFESSVVDVLIELLDADDQRTVQLAVGSLLGRTPHVVETRILGMLEEDEWSSSAKGKAVFVLGKIGSDRSRSTLESLQHTSEDEDFNRQITAALAKLGGVAP